MISTLLGLAITVIVVAIVVRPLLVGVPGAESGQKSARTSQRARQMAELAEALEARNYAYEAIKELDLEHELGKVSDDDYAAQRAELVHEAVALVKQLDALEAAMPKQTKDIEAAINAMRREKA